MSFLMLLKEMLVLSFKIEKSHIITQLEQTLILHV